MTSCQSPEVAARQLSEHLVTATGLLTELAARLSVLGASQWGSATVIEVATAEVVGVLERLDDLDGEGRRLIAGLAEEAGSSDGSLSPADLDALAARSGLPLAEQRTAMLAAADRARREAQLAGLELAHVLADLQEVQRLVTGDPGTYDSAGQTGAVALRRLRGVG